MASTNGKLLHKEWYHKLKPKSLILEKRKPIPDAEKLVTAST
jgi:hypothetical protein